MTDRTPLDAPLEHFSRKSPLHVSNSERTSYRWVTMAGPVTGNTPAELEDRAKEQVSQLTGVPAQKLAVAGKYTIYPVPGDDERESHMSYDAKRARSIAGGDTLFAVIQVAEPLPDSKWDKLRKRVDENFELAREGHAASIAEGKESFTAYAMADTLRAVQSWMDVFDES